MPLHFFSSLCILPGCVYIYVLYISQLGAIRVCWAAARLVPGVPRRTANPRKILFPSASSGGEERNLDALRNFFFLSPICFSIELFSRPFWPARFLQWRVPRLAAGDTFPQVAPLVDSRQQQRQLTRASRRENAPRLLLLKDEEN